MTTAEESTITDWLGDRAFTYVLPVNDWLPVKCTMFGIEPELVAFRFMEFANATPMLPPPLIFKSNPAGLDMLMSPAVEVRFPALNTVSGDAATLLMLIEAPEVVLSDDVFKLAAFILMAPTAVTLPVMFTAPFAFRVKAFAADEPRFKFPLLETITEPEAFAIKVPTTLVLILPILPPAAFNVRF